MYIYTMPNKTIYVSQKDEKLFEEAQAIAGEALSSVIARALREFVSRSQSRMEGMKEVSVKIGTKGFEREQRFIGAKIGKWEGLNDDKSLYMNAKIYVTGKNNLVVLLTTLSRASLITNPKEWKKSGAYLENVYSSDLFVGEKPGNFKGKIPNDLVNVVKELYDKEDSNVEYLDI